MQWLNEPPHWTEDDNNLTLTVAPNTDFWRKTHNGAIRDNGHFRYTEVDGDFTAEVKLTAEYIARYDQAGIMLRSDETTWLKCGIEYVDGVQHASAVVTRDYSDWSVVPLHPAPESVWFRLKRHGATVEVFYSLNGTDYTMIRTAHLTAAQALQLGLMAAAPQGDGFTVMFEAWRIL